MNRYIRYNSESGSFLLFFGGFVLPVALVFLGFGLVLLKLNLEYQSAQLLIDKVTTSASKKLPFVSAATESALFALNEYGIDRQDVDLDVTPSSVTIRYRDRFPAFLGGLLSNENKKTYTVAASSSAKINARDIAIFVDASSYLAPEPSSSTADAWNETSAEKAIRLSNGLGNEQSIRSEWPSAQYFRQNLTNASLRGQAIHPRLLTQQCFNSAFSALKDASIRIYDYYAMNSENSVGVLIGPGSVENVTILRNIISPSDRNYSPGEGRFDFFGDERNIASDEACLAAAKNEERHTGYNIPPRGTSSLWGKPHFPDAPDNIINVDERFIDRRRLGELSMRDILWSLAARRSYRSGAPQTTVVDFNLAIDKVANMLLGAPYRSERAGMNQNISKVGILMLGDIPWVHGKRLSSPVPSSTTSVNPRHQIDRSVRNRIRDKLLEIEKRAKRASVKIQLYISLTKHLGNYPPAIYPTCVSRLDNGAASICQQFDFDVMHLSYIFQNNGEHTEGGQGFLDGKYLQIQLLRSPDTEALAKSLPAWLPLMNRSVVRTR